MAIKTASTRKTTSSSTLSSTYSTTVIITQVVITDSNYTALDDTAILNAGGYIKIFGIGFRSGYSLYFNGVVITTSTLISSNEIRAVIPSIANGSYNLTVFNTNNTGALYVLTASGFPTWTTGIYNVTGTSIVNVQLLVTGDAPLTYSLQGGSTLPSGVSLSSTGLLSGTVTIASESSQVFTFTVLVNDAQLQTTQQTITLNVALSEPQFTSTVLLLNAETPSTTTSFIADISTNNFPLTIVGGTKPSTYSPYYDTYNSYYHRGTDSAGTSAPIVVSDNWTIPASTAGAIGEYFATMTGDYTIEMWVYLTRTPSSAIATSSGHLFNIGSEGSYVHAYGIITTGYFVTSRTTGTPNTITASIPPIGRWNHLAFVNVGTTVTIYLNGTSVGTNTAAAGWLTGYSYISIGGYNPGNSSHNFNGYISNLRVIKGQALYTGSFTPSTTPLTRYTVGSTGTGAAGSLSGTVMLLTCQNSNLIDNSVNNYALNPSMSTTAGTRDANPVNNILSSSSTPFTIPSSVSVNTGYSVFLSNNNKITATNVGSSLTFGTGDFTIEGWVYLNQNNPSGVATTNLYDGREIVGDLTPWLRISTTIKYNTAGTDRIIGATINLFTWYHYALVRISGSTKLYVNGVQSGSTYTDTNNYIIQTPIDIGYTTTTGGTNINPQYLSNIRVVKGVGVYTGNFTVPTSPLTVTQSAGTNIVAITGTSTSLLTCQGSTLVDASTVGSAISTSTYTGGGGGQYQVKIVNNNYPFTQTTQTISNISTFGSAYFNGSTDYITIPYNSALALGSGTTWTIEYWFRRAAPNTATTLTVLSHSQDTSIRWSIYHYNIQTLTINFSSTVSVSFLFPTTATTFAHAQAGWWHHVAIVKNGGNVNAYLNGVICPYNSGTQSGNLSNITSGTFYIGTEYNQTNYMQGYISDLRLVKGTAVYTGNCFVPPTSPLTAITNTSLLTLQYNNGVNNYGFVDNSPSNHQINRIGTTGVTQGTFSPWSPAGWSNYFSGSTEYLTVSNATAFDQDTDFTVELWLNISSYPGSGDAKVYHPNGTGILVIAVSTTGKINIDDQQTGNKIVSVLTLARGVWYHIALVRNGPTTNNLTLYINGSVDTTVSYSNWQVSSTFVEIGRRTDTNIQYNGYISNLRVVKGTAVYTSSFTPSTAPLTPITNTVLLTCQSNRFIDNSPNNSALTLTGTPKVQAFSPFGSRSEATPLSYSTYFNGSTDYLTAPAGLNTAMGAGFVGNIITIECWAYPTVWTNTNTFSQTIIGSYAAVAANGRWYFGVLGSATTGKLKFSYTTGTGSQVELESTTNIAFLNKWTHVAVTINATTAASTTVKLFVDGILTDTFASQNFTTQTTYYSAPNIGGNMYLSPWTGYISNLRVLTGIELYTTTFTPSTTPLTAIANTSLLTCQSTTIIDNSTNNFAITAATATATPVKLNPFGYTPSTYTSYTPSLHGGSMYVAGTSGNYISIGAGSNNEGLDIYFSDTVNNTLEFWYYSDTVDQQMFSNYPWTGGISSGSPAWWLAGGGSSILTAPAAYRAKAYQWNHVVFIKLAGVQTMYGYINGYFCGSNATYTGWNNTTSGPAASLGVASAGTTTAIAYFSGFRITTGAAIYPTSSTSSASFIPPISPPTVSSVPGQTRALLNFTTTAIADQHSSNTYWGSPSIQRSFIIKKYGNASIYFNGSSYMAPYNGSVTTPANELYFLRNDFTVEAWVYTTSLAGVQIIVTFGTETTSRWQFFINTSGQLAYDLYGTGTTNYVGSNNVTINTWTHVAIVRSGSTISAYVNGVSQGTPVSQSSSFGNGPLSIGVNSVRTAGYFVGYMDDLRITKFARYTGNFTAPQVGLAGQ